MTVDPASMTAYTMKHFDGDTLAALRRRARVEAAGAAADERDAAPHAGRRRVRGCDLDLDRRPAARRLPRRPDDRVRSRRSAELGHAGGEGEGIDATALPDAASSTSCASTPSSCRSGSSTSAAEPGAVTVDDLAALPELAYALSGRRRHGRGVRRQRAHAAARTRERGRGRGVPRAPRKPRPRAARSSGDRSRSATPTPPRSCRASTCGASTKPSGGSCSRRGSRKAAADLLGVERRAALPRSGAVQGARRRAHAVAPGPVLLAARHREDDHDVDAARRPRSRASGR